MGSQFRSPDGLVDARTRALSGLYRAFYYGMKILVTGGSGVVGKAAVSELLRRGHSVRLLSRNADQDAEQWSGQIESWPASVAEADSLRGSAENCDLVVHVAGIVSESPPEVTFANTNVEGTRNIVREAMRAKCGRLIYVSSLGADTGKSNYHRSKLTAEEIVHGFSGGWIILRPGNVYGPGDDVVSVLLSMVRTLPVVPVVNAGEDKFQPVWAEDLAQVIGAAAERTDLHGKTLELAGDEQTSMNDVIDRLISITGRNPTRIPIPSGLLSAGAALAGLAGVKMPISEEQLTMLREGNVIRVPGQNALTGIFKIVPTPLDTGLRLLADAQPEVLPSEGVGELERKLFWADISGSALSAEELFERLRTRFSELTPWHLDLQAEPGTPTSLDEGATLTMSLPLRGNIQVRVAELTPRSAVLATVRGHPLAGAVRFLTEQRGDSLRFEVQVYNRASNPIDWLAMRTVGDSLQGQTWRTLVEAMIRESGGTAADGVQNHQESLPPDQAERIDEWVRNLVMASRRDAERKTA
jgi:NADH dehydrogenase